MRLEPAGKSDTIRAPIHALAPDDWQRAPGERAAVEGLLAQIRPDALARWRSRGVGPPGRTHR
jgi:hypothetical protein